MQRAKYAPEFKEVAVKQVVVKGPQLSMLPSGWGVLKDSYIPG